VLVVPSVAYWARHCAVQRAGFGSARPTAFRRAPPAYSPLRSPSTRLDLSASRHVEGESDGHRYLLAGLPRSHCADLPGSHQSRSLTGLPEAYLVILCSGREHAVPLRLHQYCRLRGEGELNVPQIGPRA